MQFILRALLYALKISCGFGVGVFVIIVALSFLVLLMLVICVVYHHAGLPAGLWDICNSHKNAHQVRNVCI